MKLFLLCLFFTVFHASGSIYSQNSLFNLNYNNISVGEALQVLESNSSYKFLYRSDMIDLERKVNLNGTDKNVENVLSMIFPDGDASFRFFENNLVAITTEQFIEQQIVVSGAVTDATGNPLPGASIVVQGTTIGTTTDVDGAYTLSVPGRDAILIFSFVGYISREIMVGENNVINVSLAEDLRLLDEIVVVGYGTQRRSDITGSVASISRQDIIDVPVYSMDNILQGRAAGVEVRADGFRPGEGSSIRIRGTRSFVAGNDPLIVIDGIPIEGGLIDFNPSDVESVEILKDASATAIYGSRGANGVILITTRRGDERALTVEYSGYTGLQFTFDRIDVMDTPTLAEFERNAARYHGTYTGDDADIFQPWQLEAIAENRTTDWQDLVFERGLQQSHSLSIRGGGGGTAYSVSGNFDDHRAVVTNNDFRRYSGRINFDQQIFSRLKAGVSTLITNSVQHRSVNFARVIGNSPMSSPFNEDGNPLMFDEMGDRNPLFDLQKENSLDRRIRTRMVSMIYSELDIIPGRLQLRTNFAPDLTFRNDGFYNRQELESHAGMRNDRETSFLFEGLLFYNTEFLGKHRLSVTSLYSVQNQEQLNGRLEVRGLPYEQQLFYNLGSAERVHHRSSYLSEWTLESYMLRLNYAFDNRYLFTLTSRVDGSSRLSAGNEYSIFPSMALAWQIKEERFLSNVDFLNELKLRFSIGEVGNTAISPYQTQGALMQRVVSFGDGDRIAFEHRDIPNPDLKWERTRTMDLGLDFAFLNNRIQGHIDVYQSNTKDLLLERQIPLTSGYTSVLENVGETMNKGIELGLSSVNISTPEFMWSMDLNISSNRNEIVELFGGKVDAPGSGWFIGESVNAHFDFKKIGIWQLDEADEAASYGALPGDLKFFDKTGDGRITGDDRVILGTPDPKWSGGITNRFSYKGLDFSVFIYGAQGILSYAGIGSAAFDGLLSFRTERSNLLNVNYWTPENSSNEYPRPRTTAQVYQQALAYMNTSYVRLRNVTFGYNLPEQWISRIGAQNMRVYASGHNLYTWTPFIGYDPEGATGTDMPNYQTFLLGIDLRF